MDQLADDCVNDGMQSSRMVVSGVKYSIWNCFRSLRMSKFADTLQALEFYIIFLVLGGGAIWLSWLHFGRLTLAGKGG